MEIENMRISKKKVINIVFVGHVDAGKSTICGQILVKMGLVDERTLSKYKEMAKEQNRESWYLSWCLDTNPEEREKGKTSEVGTAMLELSNTRVNILDAPGHKQYVFEMIRGANCADIGVLVISARISEFETGFERDGQTREHIFLLKAGGVKKLIVLVNKMDDPSVKWSEGRYDEIKTKIGNFLKRLFNDTLFIPISGFTGENIKEKGNSAPWYKGSTFLDYLDSVVVSRNLSAPLSITVTEKLKGVGGSFLYGKVESGHLEPNTAIKTVPQGLNCLITNIYDDEDVELEEAVHGDLVKMKFKEDIENIAIGSKIVDLKNDEYKICEEFTCGLTILDIDGIISPGYSCILHIGLNTASCKIKEIRDLENKRIRYAKQGQRILAKIKLSSPIALLNSKDDSRKETFALRFETKTIGVGFVRNIKE